MDSSYKFNIKAHIIYGSSSQPQEIRKFTIQGDHPQLKFNALAEKLQCICPGLRGKTFSVCWTDKAGDCITASTDEELCQAFVELGHRSEYRLFVKVDGEENNEIPACPNTGGELHVNVICDGCDSEIQGFRYKCLQCEDYDLCAQCEAQGLHAEHFMLRIPYPINRGYHLHHFFRKILKKCAFFDARENAEECPTRSKKRRCSSNTSSTCRRGVASVHPQKPGKSHRECPMKKHTEKKTGPSTSSASGDEARKPDDKQEWFFDFRAEQVRKMMDFLRLGWEEMEEDAPKSDTTEKATNSKDSSLEADGKSKIPANEEKKPMEDKDDNQAPAPEPAATTTQSTSPNNGKTEMADEWMIVDKNGTPHISHASSASSSLNETTPKKVETATQEASAPPQERIYPQVPDNNTVYHSNPKIQSAIETMIAMGFSNKGGLLTYLLDAENGNIEKVLDLLQPSKR